MEKYKYTCPKSQILMKVFDKIAIIQGHGAALWLGDTSPAAIQRLSEIIDSAYLKGKADKSKEICAVLGLESK